MANKQSTLTKINVLNKAKLDSLDLSKHIGEIFATTDKPYYNAAINFAEEERLKSTNEWLYGDIVGTGYVEVVLTNLKPNSKYVLSVYCESEDTDDDRSTLAILYDGTSNSTDVFCDRNKINKIDFVPASNSVTLRFCAAMSEKASEGDSFKYSNIVLHSESFLKEYPQYKGDIVHEKDDTIVFAEAERQKSETDGVIVHENQLNSAVGKRELIYQHTDAINLRESTLTTLQAFFKMFDLDTTKTYRLSADPNMTPNFLAVIGRPPRVSDNDYCQIHVKMINAGITNSGASYHPYRVYQVLGGNTQGVTGIKYVKSNPNDTYIQGQWNEIL